MLTQSDSDYLSGQWTFSVYEAATGKQSSLCGHRNNKHILTYLGYYNPYNYEITEMALNFAEPTSSPSYPAKAK